MLLIACLLWFVFPLSSPVSNKMLCLLELAPLEVLVYLKVSMSRPCRTWLVRWPLPGPSPCSLNPHCSLTFISVSFLHTPCSKKLSWYGKKTKILRWLWEKKKTSFLKALDKTLRNSSNLAEKSLGSIDYALGNSLKCWDSKSIVNSGRYILSSLCSALVPVFVLIWRTATQA